ncbi:hypothetical protein ACFL3A_08700 [Pseudomonadota bacterium]
MKKLKNMRSAVTFLALALAASASPGAGLQNNISTMEPVILASVITSNAIPTSSNADIANVAETSKLFWVFGASLVGVSLVTRRRSV